MTEFIDVPFELAAPIPIEYADLRLDEAEVPADTWVERLREAGPGEWDAPLFHLEELGWEVQGYPEAGGEVRVVGPDRDLTVRFSDD